MTLFRHILTWGLRKGITGAVTATGNALKNAEIKKELDREASDPEYKEYKDKIRRENRIARENEDRRSGRRSAIWRVSKRAYVSCFLYSLISPYLYDSVFRFASKSPSLAGIYSVENAYLEFIHNHALYQPYLSVKPMPLDLIVSTLLVVWSLSLLIWAFLEAKEMSNGCFAPIGLIFLLVFGYLFVCQCVYFGLSVPNGVANLS